MLPIAIYKEDMQQQSQQIVYIHSDHLNTPRMATDQNQTTVWQWHSSAFGEELPIENGLTFNLRFPGLYYDAESKTHYNYYRDYDAQRGRYLQSDPIGLAGGMNTYSYVGGNPIGSVDPYGLWGVQAAGIIIGAGFGIYNAMQNPCNDIQDILISAGIGAATGFVASFGAGPWAAAAFGAGASMSGAVVEQLVNSGTITSIDSIIISGVVGGLTGGIANAVGQSISPAIVKEYGVLASAAQVKPGQTQRMLARPNIYGPDQKVVDGVGIGIGAQVSAAQAANNSTFYEKQSVNCECN